MSGDLASCIVPVYNGQRYLGQAIESILAQSYRPLEVIVVDDGSTDGTPAVAAGFGEAVRYLRQENAGPAAARNRGVGAAQGEWLAFLDADDLWHPEKLARQVRALTADPALQCSVCLIQNFWMPELEAESRAFRDHPRGEPLPGYVCDGMVLRRTVFQHVGEFDRALGHSDQMEWFIRARAAGLVDRLLPEVLVWRRLHSDNLSRVSADASRDEFLGLLKRSLDRRRGAPPQEPSR